MSGEALCLLKVGVDVAVGRRNRVVSCQGPPSGSGPAEDWSWWCTLTGGCGSRPGPCTRGSRCSEVHSAAAAGLGKLGPNR